MSSPCKFEQLRAKTDQQLAALIERQIERGINLIQTHGRWQEAESAYAEARRLAFTVYDAERRVQVEAHLEDLRRALGEDAKTLAAGG